MKKLLLITVLIFVFSITATAQNDSITVSTSPFSVNINEKEYTEDKTYPALFHNNTVYLPMTYTAGTYLGKSIEWVHGYERDVLLVEENAAYGTFADASAKRPEVKYRNVQAMISDCTVAIRNGEYLSFISGTDEYPLLMFKDIIYIPLTWETISKKFCWNYSFDISSGLHIDTTPARTVEKLEPDVYTSTDGSTTCYILDRKKYIDGDGYDSTDWTGLIRYNHDMTGKELYCLGMSDFIIERELAQPVKQGDIRFFKTYKENKFTAPLTKDIWTFLYSATTMMLDTRTGCINKWNSLPSWRQSITQDDEHGITSISMSGTDYVSDSIDIINSEDYDIELKSIPMQYVIKRVENGVSTVILTYDVPEFPGGSIVVPAPTSAITKLHIGLPPWDFRDAYGNYVPEGQYEISLIVPDTVEYVINGTTVVVEAPKGTFINSTTNLVK